MQRTRKIAASLMCADLVELRKDLDVFASTEVDYLHLDIMDGHYVPNFTLGVDFCRAVAAYSRIPLDIHLMVESPERFVPDFAVFPGSAVSFHPEACYHPQRTLSLIRSYGARSGIAIGVATPLESIRWLLEDIDLLCVMCVNPGYAGQKLVRQTIEKLEQIAAFVHDRGLAIDIEVDGNVSWENAPRMLSAGADVLVAGSSSIFDGEESLTGSILKLRALMDARDE
jgi:ribulose-phosphate 3-epimerase